MMSIFGNRFQHLLIYTLVFSLLAPVNSFANQFTLEDTFEKPLQGVGFSPRNEPKTTDELIKRVTADSNNRLSKSRLLQLRDQYRAAASFLGHHSDVEGLALSLLSQHTYLELYKATRLEYLMFNYAKTLLMDPKNTKELALWKFDRHVKRSYVQDYPHLKKKRKETRDWLSKSMEDYDERKKTRDFVLGTIESAYFSLYYVDQLIEFQNERNSSDYQKLNQFAEWRNVVLGSMSILNTDAFEDDVTPYYDDWQEGVPAGHEAKEQALNLYRSEFGKFIEEQKMVEGLEDFLESDEIRKISKGLANALELPSQLRFRNRIARTFPKAMRELTKNLEYEFNSYQERFQEFPLLDHLVQSNTRSNANSKALGKWLYNVFTEQALHWALAEEYPYLQRSTEKLTEVVNQEMRRQAGNRRLRYTVMTLALAISPFGRTGNSLTKWMGQPGIYAIRAICLGTEIVLAGTMLMDAVNEYYHWRDIQRLTATSVDSAGLANAAQEESAFASFRNSSLLAGFSVGLTVMSGMGYRSAGKAGRNTGPFNFVKTAAANTVNGNGSTLRAYVRLMNRQFKRFRASLKVLKMGQALRSAGSIGVTSAAYMTQWMVLPVAAINQFTGGYLKMLIPTISQGVVYGIVMGVTGALFQHRINAASLSFIVDSWEKMGWTPDSFWLKNSLNKEQIINRDAFLVVDSELTHAIGEIAKLTGMMAAWNNLIDQGGLGASEIEDLKAAIAGSKLTIRHHLRLQIARWYQRPEYRKIANSVMKEKGFGLVVSPSMEEPKSMTLILKMGSKSYSYFATGKQLDEMKDRKIVPDVRKNLKTFLDQMGQVEDLESVENR